MKKINANELLDKMNSDHKQKELSKKQNQSQNFNANLINNNFVRNTSKQLTQKRGKIKTKEN